MYATAVVGLDRRDEPLTLPATAIMRNGAEAACMVVESGKATRRVVAAGLRVGPDIEIVRGLSEGSEVVTLRPEALSEGQMVHPRPSPK